MVDETSKAEPQNIVEALLNPSQEQMRVRSARFQSFYANNLALSFSSYDCSLIFGEITGMKHEDKPVVEEVFRVTMTREVTKALLLALKTNLEAYEKQFGEIKEIEVKQISVGPILPQLTE